MSKKIIKLNPIIKKRGDYDVDIPAYPLYPESEDIYNKSQEVKDINLEDLSKIKDVRNFEVIDSKKDKELHDILYGGDLDIPGSELDDEQENTGNEDEENNYYSIGGDEHTDLTENQGDEK